VEESKPSFPIEEYMIEPMTQRLRQATFGLSEKIPNYYFSTMKISQPLTEHAFLFSDDPSISSAPFFDQQRWESEFNDKMFVQKSGPATWTHLQVKKAGLA
jgi:hypothetical protein